MKTMKTCTKCGTAQPLANFAVKNKLKGTHNAYCRECNKAYQKLHYKANKDVYKAKARKYELDHGGAQAFRHGLTADRLSGMLSKYEGKCWICKERDATIVDHDHSCCDTKNGSCGKCVRGVLCKPCNTAIGLLGDNLTGVQRAIEYLA